MKYDFEKKRNRPQSAAACLSRKKNSNVISSCQSTSSKKFRPSTAVGSGYKDKSDSFFSFSSSPSMDSDSFSSTPSSLPSSSSYSKSTFLSSLTVNHSSSSVPVPIPPQVKPKSRGKPSSSPSSTDSKDISGIMGNSSSSMDTLSLLLLSSSKQEVSPYSSLTSNIKDLKQGSISDNLSSSSSFGVICGDCARFFYYCSNNI
jgi:hypothetical protein